MSRQSISNVNCSVLSKSEINGKRDTRCVLQPTGVVHTDCVSRAQEMEAKYRKSKAELDELVANMEGL
jgi:hypothetical protein